MLKVFQHLRKRLINEKKTKAYFAYAFGEILLIVVGILLAIQLNEWKENLRAKSEEKESLTVIRKNLKSERERLNQVIQVSQETMRLTEKLLRGRLDSIDVENYFWELTTSHPHWHFNTGYNALVNSNKIDLISNDVLLEEIILFYDALYRRLDLVGDYDEQFMQNKLEPYFFKNIPIEKKHSSKREILIRELEKLEFRNLLSMTIIINKFKIRVIQNEAFISMDKMDDLLNNELLE